MRIITLTLCGIGLASCSRAAGFFPLPAGLHNEIPASRVRQSLVSFFGRQAQHRAVFKHLFNFNGWDGQDPQARLVYVGGLLYGTTFAGGVNGAGTVFKITKSGKETPLYSFKGGADGANPFAGLIDVKGTLYGTTSSGVAFGINERDQIVGQSCDASFNCRAFIWQNGVMHDLNALVPDSSLSLMLAESINKSGEITGIAYDPSTGGIPAYVAIPKGGGIDATPRSKTVLPADVRIRIQQMPLSGRFGAPSFSQFLKPSWL